MTDEVKPFKVLNLNQAFDVLQVDVVRHSQMPERVANVLRFELEGWITVQQLLSDLQDSLSVGNIFTTVSEHLDGVTEVLAAQQTAEALVKRYVALEKIAAVRAQSARDFFEEYGLAKILYFVDVYEKYLLVKMVDDYFGEVEGAYLFINADHLIEVANGIKKLNVTDRGDTKKMLGDFDLTAKEFDYFTRLSPDQFADVAHSLREGARRAGVKADCGPFDQTSTM